MFLKEKLAWNYLVAFGFLAVAAFFARSFVANSQSPSYDVAVVQEPVAWHDE